MGSWRFAAEQKRKKEYLEKLIENQEKSLPIHVV